MTDVDAAGKPQADSALFREGQPVPWFTVRVAIGMLLALAVAEAVRVVVFGEDWADSADMQAMPLGLAAVFMVWGAAKGVRNRRLAFFAGFGALFAVGFPVAAIANLLPATPTVSAATAFVGCALGGLVMVATFVAVTHARLRSKPANVEDRPH